jgi:hypothetical protein
MRDVRSLSLWLAAALLAGNGCVHREIEIMSRPPGARVEYDGQPLPDDTPARFEFSWYGWHEMILTKPGYHRERLIILMKPPWYEQFPIDLFSDLLWPGRLYDIHTFPFVLEKAIPMDDVPDDEKTAMKSGLIERAEHFRRMAWEEVGRPPVEKKEEPKPEKKEEKREGADKEPPEAK